MLPVARQRDFVALSQGHQQQRVRADEFDLDVAMQPALCRLEQLGRQLSLQAVGKAREASAGHHGQRLVVQLNACAANATGIAHGQRDARCLARFTTPRKRLDSGGAGGARQSARKRAVTLKVLAVKMPRCSGVI